MVKQKDAAKMYKQKQLESASPIQLLLMLYDAALDHLGRAERALETMDQPASVETFHKSLVTTQDIITELTVALDMEQGGDLAPKLFQLYEYMSYRLVEVNLSRQAEGLEDIKRLLNTLKSGWETVASKDPKAKKPNPDNQDIGINIQG